MFYSSVMFSGITVWCTLSVCIYLLCLFYTWRVSFFDTYNETEAALQSSLLFGPLLWVYSHPCIYIYIIVLLSYIFFSALCLYIFYHYVKHCYSVCHMSFCKFITLSSLIYCGSLHNCFKVQCTASLCMFRVQLCSNFSVCSKCWIVQ